MEAAKVGVSRHGNRVRDIRWGQGLLRRYRFATPIELQTERPAEGRQSPFGGIGLCCLERDVVHLARRCSAAFAGAMALPNDGRAVLQPVIKRKNVSNTILQ